VCQLAQVQGASAQAAFGADDTLSTIERRSCERRRTVARACSTHPTESISDFLDGPVEYEPGNLKKNVAASRGIDESPDHDGNAMVRLKNLCRQNQIGVEATGQIEYP